MNVFILVVKEFNFDVSQYELCRRVFFLSFVLIFALIFRKPLITPKFYFHLHPAQNKQCFWQF